MTTPTSDLLRFPSQEAIAGYLAKHPLTSGHHTAEKRINDAAATAFANSKKVEMGVEKGVALTIRDVSEKLNFPKPVLTFITRNLTQALIDCAKGKLIELEKVEHKDQPFSLEKSE